jgi:cytochrome c553
MKKIIIGLFTLGVLTVSLHAYDQAERIQDMQTMEVSMAQIQKGILYNNKKMAIQGVESLKNASSKVEVAPKTEMDYSAVFAKKQAVNIVKFADKVKENIEAGHKHAAATNYTKVLDQCISCHNKIRKWN